MPVEIGGVEKGSPAWKAGLRGGMRLCAIDGHEICDGLDYEFYATSQNPVVLAEENGKARRFRVKKREEEPLGCLFETYLISPQHPCKNRCVFCFIDQLPKGMRPSLYFKDDDERLGFLFGNYITLTNLGEREIERIVEMRFSPVNISVHTANPELRVQMMGNRHAGKALEVLPRLAAAGIQMNTQLVLCPQLNDGEELRRSLDWLAGMYPAVQSIAAVPVGLTRHREGLAQLSAYTPGQAAAQLDILLAYGEEMFKRHGERVVFPSDEWFLLAGRPIPPDAFYEGYPQLENGVGMWRMLHGEFAAALAEIEAPPPPCEADLATGLLAAPLLRELAALAHSHYPQLKLHVHAVENRFFGPGVTVAGLLTGGDICQQLTGKLATGNLLLPANMLRAEGDIFLDGLSPAELAGSLGVRVQMLPCDGAALLDALLDCH